MIIRLAKEYGLLKIELSQVWEHINFKIYSTLKIYKNLFKINI